LIELFNEVNINYNLKTFASSAGPLSVNLFDNKTRIFFLAMYSGNARSVICEAYKAGIRYPRHAFIIYGWYSPGWWIPPPSFNCTREQIESVLLYSIAVLQHQFTTNESAPTDTGITYSEYDTTYRHDISKLGYNYSPHSIQCFDGIWAFAFALNQTITKLMYNETFNELASAVEDIVDNGSFQIENVTYKNYIIKQAMFEYLSQTNFMGISGSVTFTDVGIRTVNRLRIFQYRNESDIVDVQIIATVSASNRSFTYLLLESDETVWISGNPPYDGTPTIEIVSVPIPVTVIYSLLSLCGITFAISCLIFILIFRKHKLIKLASPSLNYIIIIGAVMMYISGILYVIPGYDQITVSVFCNVQPRVFSLSYTLCFGTILVKTWRIYYIFTNPKPNKKKYSMISLTLSFITLINGISRYTSCSSPIICTAVFFKFGDTLSNY
jgi:gamma-aminobutyric acid type B receptor